MAASLPNWIRILLLVLSLISFLPQLREFWLRRNACGISPYYVLFQLIGATELFALAFYYVVNSVQTSPGPDFFTHNPPQLGDYLNLAQMALVWVLWLIVFAAVLLLPSESLDRAPGARNSTAPTVLAIYLAFLLISIIPVVVDAAWPSQDASSHEWAMALFHGIHTMLINPIVTILILVSFFSQRGEILQHPPGTASSSLSLIGLAVQAVVFAVLALAWAWRFVFPGGASVGYGMTWYQLVGFVAVDHIAFALVQAALLAFVVLHRGQGFTGGETEPLLDNRN
ncbi:hypothetical protein M431DRAFT_534799 [Trichoderma harzianum CBS 226.95]|uniref:Uncharacterized protein n=1 Tax=Trichoderma harzianum CBS 226.95 TaxID=983964 RepID=A0A2T3ZX49_TRIHA|nr:hypothetical protein M431DRAFT_534799 [Trichoderma harzianum CBS 226.95]PTB49394.1 hypothetical protein M431DRAFT_534799 [Trichoderma harzianum CBS 226.95]